MQTKEEHRKELQKELDTLNAEYDALQDKALKAKGDVLEATAKKIEELRERREGVTRTLKRIFPRPRPH